MLAAFAALALLPHLPNPFGPFQPETGVKAYAFDTAGWHVAQRRDSFTGLASCRLDAGGVRYAHGVVTFNLGERIDTANAVFRVDGGPARTVGSVATEAAGLGAPFLTRDTWNPSHGRVHVPASQVKGAKTIAIRADPRHAPRAFRLAGLDTAMADARARGCSDIV